MTKKVSSNFPDVKLNRDAGSTAETVFEEEVRVVDAHVLRGIATRSHARYITLQFQEGS